MGFCAPPAMMTDDSLCTAMDKHRPGVGAELINRCCRMLITATLSPFTSQRDLVALGAGAVAGASAHHALRHVAGEPRSTLRAIVGVLAEALRATPAGLNRAGAAGAAREGASDVLAAGLARVARVALRHTAAVAAAGLVAAFGLSALVAPHLGAGAITTAARARVATVEPGVAAHVDAVAPLVTSVRLLRARRAAGAGRCWQQRCVRQLLELRQPAAGR